MNCVLHRRNIDSVDSIIDMAVELGARRLELANTQYHGWATVNRDALMPTRAQLERGEEAVMRARERLGAKLEILWVLPDYYEEVPKPCMGGWAHDAILVQPNGDVLPCQAAASIPGFTPQNVRDRSLAAIWFESKLFNAFRGTDWMQEPCRTCPINRQHEDFGGCRCQALALTGDAAATDPVCQFSPHHDSDRGGAAGGGRGGARGAGAVRLSRPDPVVSAEPVVQAFGLGKDYGSLRAVEAVDMAVGTGEFFGFLGPNGAGKTTMIHMLTTLVSPSRGRAEVAGNDVVLDPLAVRKNIGLVFQETTLDGELSAEENLQLAGKLYGLRRADLRGRIEEVLELFELTDRRHDSVRTFSGGMRRQVDLARGILHRPTVLFLDEPTLGLDPVNRGRVWGFLERLAAEEGMTLFLTTHYLEEAEPCDRVMIVDRGQVIAQGTPDELKRDLGGRESIELVMSDPDPRLLARSSAAPGPNRAAPTPV